MKIIEKIKEQHPLMQILDVIFVVLFIYEAVTMKIHSVTWAILFLIIIIPFCQWFFKKEE